MTPTKPTIIPGASYTDHRGTISFVNDFKFEGVTRFYTIHHPSTDIIRAWQGHTHESKYYYPAKGTWLIAWVKMDFSIPEDQWQAEHITLKASDDKMLFLPPGYANGFKALETDSIITGFSVPGKEEETLLRWNANKWMDWDV
ncbi:MAG: dTDP-4-dehydrorhamnose 3,5-epimerase [Bacteroidales bacterium]|nr:dTDP-4-dehydrorhamnose 3,5-epimerase [Bacteroidales bacterium]